MTDLERLRHSTAHVLATAILRIWPEAQFAAGPPVENGFYYDVDLAHRISPDDFEKIEAEMKKEIKANHPFERIEVSREEAHRAWPRTVDSAALKERPGNPSKFKLDIIDKIPGGEAISLFQNGDFIDLCAGPHVMRTGQHRRVQAHARRQRVLQGRREESAAPARLRHRLQEQDGDSTPTSRCSKKRRSAIIASLARRLELFVFDDDVGPGLPMFLPRGAVIAEELEKLAKETEFAAGYQRVRTPHIARESLYERAVTSFTTSTRCSRR